MRGFQATLLVLVNVVSLPVTFFSTTSLAFKEVQLYFPELHVIVFNRDIFVASNLFWQKEEPSLFQGNFC